MTILLEGLVALRVPSLFSHVCSSSLWHQEIGVLSLALYGSSFFFPPWSFSRNYQPFSNTSFTCYDMNNLRCCTYILPTAWSSKLVSYLLILHLSHTYVHIYKVPLSTWQMQRNSYRWPKKKNWCSFCGFVVYIENSATSRRLPILDINLINVKTLYFQYRHFPVTLHAISWCNCDLPYYKLIQ